MTIPGSPQSQPGDSTAPTEPNVVPPFSTEVTTPGSPQSQRRISIVAGAVGGGFGILTLVALLGILVAAVWILIRKRGYMFKVFMANCKK